MKDTSGLGGAGAVGAGVTNSDTASPEGRGAKEMHHEFEFDGLWFPGSEPEFAGGGVAVKGTAARARVVAAAARGKVRSLAGGVHQASSPTQRASLSR